MKCAQQALSSIGLELAKLNNEFAQLHTQRNDYHVGAAAIALANACASVEMLRLAMENLNQ